MRESKMLDMLKGFSFKKTALGLIRRDMIEKEITINKFKYYLYTFLGKVLPCVIIIISIFVDTKYVIVLVPLSFVDMFVNSRERFEIKSKGVLYLRKIIKAAKKIKNIKDENIKNYTDKIASILKEIKVIDIGTKFVGFANMWGGVFEALSVISPKDDLKEGKSFYMAEILRYLNKHKTISIVTTHDRELVDILKENYEFYYFSENVNSKGLSFDYKLKGGISQTRNAIKILEYMNYPKEIIDSSYKRAKDIEGFI